MNYVKSAVRSRSDYHGRYLEIKDRIVTQLRPPFRQLYGDEMTDKSDRPALDSLAKQLADSVPAHHKSMSEDMERNFKSLLQSALARMDLVTREEFDVQTAVLARTREKLEALEARLKDLEPQLPD